MISRWTFVRRLATKAERQIGSIGEFPQLNDQQLLEAIENDPDIVNNKSWRRSYYHQLSQLTEALDARFKEQLDKNMHKIKSYNDRINTTIESRITVDITRDKLRFEDFYPNKVVSKAIASKLGFVTTTDFQRRLFALATGFISTVAVGEPGTGKTSSLFVHSLFLRRMNARGEGINSLLLVNSGQQAAKLEHMAQKIFSGILEQIPRQGASYKEMAQFLYRADEATEKKQINALMENPCPHVLVSTPQRLLDLLSTRGMDFLKVQSLAYIAVDDIDHMMEVSLPISKQRKTPIIQLLDYVLKLQDYNRIHNEPHPQLAFTTTSPTPSVFLDELRENTQWFDWSKFHEMGNFQDTQMAATNLVPKNVVFGCVLVRSQLSKSKKLRTDLIDMKPPLYPERMDWEYAATGEPKFLEYWKHKRSHMSKDIVDGELQVLISGVLKLFKKKKDDYPGRVLMVVSDETSVLKTQKMLEKLKRPVIVYSGQDLEDTPNSCLIVANGKSVAGIGFKNINTMMVLGLDVVRDIHRFVHLAGRFRNAAGLVSSDLYGVVDDDKYPVNKMILLAPDLATGSEERNQISRLSLRGGLVQWTPVVGIREK
ncbi:hypothetical protein OGAPHI_002774 [Ogataea philodendri]|uniref:ATP-dependent RNA helicase n=1 Tax=Ogataea philodendri TaxID=1378263 RepID=A0A9P8P8F9_9ASCO|nr:uncharacterized protein OGAPHI_002774 [Ogataea philodendri]KAH3667125.1 hypothetical protein OGAPHI_002774 [Ogataea philodendri]